MPSVFVTTYELTGAAANMAREHLAAVSAVRAEWWKFAQSQGARGFRPRHYGLPPTSLIFDGDEAPKCWRYWGRPAPNTTEAVPHKGSKGGKLAAAAMASLPRAPKDEDLIAELGWGHSPMDGRSVYFATLTALELPTPRYFVRLPRFEGDEWTSPGSMTAVPESDFMRAVEAHNAEVRLREAKTEDGSQTSVQRDGEGSVGAAEAKS